MRQHADRIEPDVAPQLEPEFVADAVLHRSLQAGGGEKLGEPRDILADCAGGLAERKLIAVDVLDDAGRHDFSCGSWAPNARSGPSSRHCRPPGSMLSSVEFS